MEYIACLKLKVPTMDGFFSHRIFFVFVHIILYTISAAQDDSLIVQASCGSLRGRLEPVVNGLSVRQFLGIPYAQPPTGQLRFARPQPANQWTGTRDAVTFGPECPQISLKQIAKELGSTAVNADDEEEVPQSEDCLSLNVYTPSHTTVQDKLAVMVWIHGGGYVLGSGRAHNPSVLVALNDVIVVTINYRLGVLGFFNIPGTDVKGNYGMHDQILSLKWVQQNIAAFGGDPDLVTIFGQSAGGMSVSSHLISPLSKGLFHRVIAQSGSSTSPYSGIRLKSTKALEIFSKVLNCDSKDDTMMECLRSKKAKAILTAQRNAALNEFSFLARPNVDGEFLPDDPRNLLKHGKVNTADVIMGLTSNEMAFNYLLARQMYKDGSLDMQGLKASTRFTVFPMHAHSQLLEDAVVFEYIDHSDPNNASKLRQASFDIGTDLTFLEPAVIEASALAETRNNVYFYVFDHTPHLMNNPTWMGAYHCVDISYVFGMPVKMDGFGEDIKWFSPSKFSDLEVGFSTYIMRLWTNFAKHGDPNHGDGMPVTWPRYNTTGHVHLRIAMEPKVGHNLRERKVAFWNEFFPKLFGIDKAKGDGHGAEQKPKDEL